MVEKIKVYKNGGCAFMDRCGIGWRVFARSPAGAVLDKVRTDDKRMAREYYRAFCQLAKNA